MRVKWGGVILGSTLAAVVLTVLPVAANAGSGKEHKARGKVISMSVAADGTGSLTVLMRKHKKTSGPAGTIPEVETKTFQIGPNTVCEAVTDSGTKPVTLAAIHKGERVVIEASSGSADKVEIVAPHHKNMHKVVVVTAT
jgi:hypothetical protein